jgi:general secretion pathway protein J
MVIQPTNKNKFSRGFTLLEILLAIFIMSLVLTTVYASYSYSLRIVHDVTYEQVVYKASRLVFDRMIKDLSSLQKSGDDFFLRSDENSIDGREFQTLTFWSAAHLDFDEKAVTQRPAVISYFVRKTEDDESFSLLRGDVPGVVPEEPEEAKQRGFVICEKINKLKFFFYDERGRETEIWDSWPTPSRPQSKVPAAVKIEMELENKNDAERPYKFMTTVFIPAKK